MPKTEPKPKRKPVPNPNEVHRTIRFPPDVFEQLTQLAKKDMRSFNSQVVLAAKRMIESEEE